MLRCSLKFNPQSVIRYQQCALWVKMSNIRSWHESIYTHRDEAMVAVEGGGGGVVRLQKNTVIVPTVHYGANKERERLLFVISLQVIEDILYAI